ncbi:MAG: carbohydrate ABC transporter substrate-binding protein, partial [Ruminococcus sp.]
WKTTFGEDCFFVPMPKDPESDTYYVAGKMNAYCFVKGGHNPEGVAKYLDCLRFTKLSEEVKELDNQKLKDDYGWTDEMIEMANTMNEMALENPTFDFYAGVSSDITDVLDSSVNGIRATAHGTPWGESVSAVYAQIQNFVDEVNESAIAE